MPTNLNPFSMLLGAASLGVVLLTLSAFQVTTASSPTTKPWNQLGLTIDGPIQIEGIPTPSQMMRVVEGAPLVVPAGKVFVLTALGTKLASAGTTSFEIDGVEWVRAVHDAETSMRSVPPGLTAQAGQTITLTNGIGNGAAWGYLADAN